MHSPSSSELRSNPEGRKLLAVTSFPAYPPRDGLRLRVCALLRELSLHWQITLVAPPPRDHSDRSDVESVARIVEVTLSGRWTHFPFQYDPAPLQEAVHHEIRRWRPTAALLWTGSEFLALNHDRFPPHVVDRVDCMSLQAARSLRHVSSPKDLFKRLNDLRRHLAYERKVADLAYATVVVGEDDARWLRRFSGADNIHVIPNGVNIGPKPPSGLDSEEPTVVFTGVMGYEPNVDAARFFATEVWPKVRAAVPRAVFRIIGREPTLEVLKLQEIAGVEVTGEVPDMTAALSRSWVAVAPMRRGSGIKNKVLEAWAAGKPVVLTSIATNGLEGAGEFEELIADAPAHLGEVVIRLLRHPEERRRFGELAYAAAQRQSWEHAGQRMSHLLEAACRATVGV